MKIRLVIVALPFLAACSVVGVRTTEEAPYSVVEEDGSFELRRYDELLVARTSMDSTYDDGGNGEFRRLFRYISGGNATGESIAMTAPVIQERGGDRWSMSFVMPSGYDLAALPEPAAPEVALDRVPPRLVAAVRYTGLTSEEKIRDRAGLLEAWVREKGLTPVSAPRSARYDPPWTIPFLRRNEVLIDVE